MVKRGASPAYGDLSIRILRKVLDAPRNNPPRYNELFKGLRCSKTTFDLAVKELVRKHVLEFDYETKGFKITAEGLNLIAPWGRDKSYYGSRIFYRFPDSYMAFMFESGMFKDKQDAAKAALQFCLGYMQRYVLDELRNKDETLHQYQAAIRNYLLEDLKALAKKHQFDFKKSDLDGVVPWTINEISPFQLMFSSDQQCREGALTGSVTTRKPDGTFERRDTGATALADFLRKRFRSFDEKALRQALEEQRR